MSNDKILDDNAQLKKINKATILRLGQSNDYQSGPEEWIIDYAIIQLNLIWDHFAGNQGAILKAAELTVTGDLLFEMHRKSDQYFKVIGMNELENNIALMVVQIISSAEPMFKTLHKLILAEAKKTEFLRDELYEATPTLENFIKFISNSGFNELTGVLYKHQ